VLIPIVCSAQNTDSTFNPKVLSGRAISKIENDINTIEENIEKKTFKTLQKLQKQETKLKKVLSLKDSIAAKQLFNIDNKYKELTSKLRDASKIHGLQEYIPNLDSLTSGFKFLEQAKSLEGKFSKEWASKISGVNKSVDDLKSKLQQANEVKAFIKERRQQLKEQFEKYGLGKHLKKLNKEVYYYQQQLNEYKAMLKDPKKLEQRAIAELTKLPAFKEFMKKHSHLASLFRLPDNYGSAESLAGLQTRASVQNQLQVRFTGSSINPQQYIQQQMGQAQGELNKIKDKLNKLGGGSSDLEMPDFKPNQQKTKSFLKRLEYGANVQSQKTNGLLPVTSDLALTAGYKLNDKSVIGIGASYKLGWGRSFEHIKITHEGIGLRSYIDWKIKGSFWISGGFEQNYQHAFTKIEDLKVFDAWQTSGLVGLSKKYKIGKKTNNMQLLWDFMSYQQVPRRQPLLFRVGVGF
jgi:hypothetical protein